MRTLSAVVGGHCPVARSLKRSEIRDDLSRISLRSIRATELLDRNCGTLIRRETGHHQRGLSRRPRPPKARLRSIPRAPHETQHRSHSDHPCRQPDPAAGADRVPARPAGAPARGRGRVRDVPDRIGRRDRAPAGRGRHRRGQRRRIRQDHQLVAICAGAAVGFRAAPDEGRRQSVRARRRPHRFAEFYAELDARDAPATSRKRSASARSPIPGRRRSSATSTISRRRSPR